MDQWVELAGGGVDTTPSDPADPDADLADGDRHAVAALTEDLLKVLDDESVAMAPPTAIGVSAEEWQRLGTRRRTYLALRHLASLDPRLVPRAVLGWSGRRSRQSHR